jgi:ABC-2 type transport system permease protein
MFGKIIGVACVALTQFFLWIILTLVLVGGFSAFVGFDSLMGDPAQTEQMMEMTAQMGGADVAEMTAAMTQEDGLGAVMNTLRDINWVQMIVAFIVYFVLGYLLYASFFAAIGSAVENEADTTQLQMPVTVPLLLAFFVAIYAFNAPDSSIVWWGSMIPFTSPIVMLSRIPFGVPTWELLLSIVLLVLTFLACGWMSAKIYKIGILMFGKKTTFKDLWKWLKQK